MLEVTALVDEGNPGPMAFIPASARASVESIEAIYASMTPGPNRPILESMALGATLEVPPASVNDNSAAGRPQVDLTQHSWASH
jgi:hypothetical protein